MKKRGMIALGLVLIFCFTACGGRTSGSTAPGAPAVQYSGSSNKAESISMEDAGLIWKDQMSVSPEEGEDSAIYRDENAKVIRRAELTIQTPEFEASVSALDALTQAQGGYYEVANVEGGGLYQQQARRSAYYVVRVPKENYNAFRDSIGEVGHLYSISEGTEDVGEAYYDTEARLATLTTKRERLLDLLEKADIMEDIISLENALADVQYQIDAHTTTLRRYDGLIGYATFRIHLDEVIKISEEVGAKESFGQRLGASFQKGVEDFGEGMQDMAIWLARNCISLILLIALTFGVIFGGRKLANKRRNRRKHVTQDSEKEE